MIPQINKFISLITDVGNVLYAGSPLVYCFREVIFRYCIWMEWSPFICLLQRILKKRSYLYQMDGQTDNSLSFDGQFQIPSNSLTFFLFLLQRFVTRYRYLLDWASCMVLNPSAFLFEVLFWLPIVLFVLQKPIFIWYDIR